MSSSDIITIARQTVWVIVKTSVPLLLVSMVVGLIISHFSDTYVNSGTDTYICSKTYRNSYRNYGNGNMDTQRDSCFYEYLMGQLQSVYIVKVLFFKFENGKVVKQ